MPLELNGWQCVHLIIFLITCQDKMLILVGGRAVRADQPNKLIKFLVSFEI